MRFYLMKKIIFIVILFSLSLPSRSIAEINIKVGVYQNKPLVFIDEMGQVRGLYIDILEAIASKEGWKVDYVECLWPECLKMLEKGSIDLMTDIAFSEERNKKYAFTNETLLSNWGQVYKRKGINLNSVLDLHNKKFCGVKGDIYYECIGSLAERFDIKLEYTDVMDYADVLELINKGSLDAGITSRLYGIMHEKNYPNIEKTPIICCPIELRFALPKDGKHTSYLIEKIDEKLRRFKANHNSIYYRSLDHWIGSVNISVTPSWLKWSMIGGGFLLLLLIVMIVLLRTTVNIKTRALKEEIEKRKKAERLIRESEAKFRNLVTKSLAGVYLIQDGVFKYCNPKLAEIFGYKVEELIDKKGPKDLSHPDDWHIVERNLKRRLSGEIDSIHYSFRGITKDKRIINVEVYGSKTEYKGRPAIIGTLLDITDRIRAERGIKERMEELENFYKMAVDRELRMKELKEEVEGLREELSRYKTKNG
jgi:PAS domain S-box-containing protein